MEKKKLTANEFFERIKKKESVSRLEFELDFKWTTELSLKLKAILKNLRYADLSSANLSYADLRYADLSSADLSSADLSYANLRSADLHCANLSHVKGTFILQYGVKLKVVE
jgi:uncharacterized protein YjbI with pentapeptide repeats